MLTESQQIINNRIILTSFIREHLDTRLACPYYIHQFESFVNAFNNEIRKLLDKAINRAIENGRNIVEEFDL